MADVLDAILPQYAEFILLNKKDAVQRAVTSYMGDPGATHEDFKNFYRLDLSTFHSFFIEVGLTDSPVGPLIAGKISPILVIRQSQSGQSYTPKIMKCRGFYDTQRETAWIKATEWDTVVNDNLISELKKQAEKERERMERIEKHMMRKTQENGE
jgi:hypothetical protein